MVGTTQNTRYELKGLEARSVNHVMVTAVNQYGEGYKPAKSTVVLTQPLSFRYTSKLYVWGQNSMSELGLSDKLVQ